ncbi:GH25 family lysozyme [Enterococcus pseudoavium]|uniref:GH25 family lysozyme n=1 Tax=Enterococcus pseudoavium TaxID=44007 RepID=A0ABU3FE90_9ENTE|nr:GH25 family lysozyme [Enterococcus pseudoavium]MDT2754591.1 GH25 family lysozyme [Enterococcus pseudoavium]MDT2769354.1 GH25 family lysozyme [Enterococcus pseudoavium]
MKNRKAILSFIIGGMMLFPVTTKAFGESLETISSTGNKLESQMSSIDEEITSSTTSEGSNTQETETSTGDIDMVTSTEPSRVSDQEMNLPTEGEAEFGGYSLPRNRSDITQSNSNGRMSRASIPSVLASNKNTPTKSFVDISSHNGTLSVSDFSNMKKYGVSGVVVKLTEATSYRNPYAASQVKNAKAAGLKVSAYHYSWFTTDSQARAEADYFASFARSVGLDNSAVMVNDIEEPQIAGKGNHTANSVAFENRLKQLGFQSVRHYSSLSWFNNLINTNTIGKQKLWVAAYPYTLTNKNYYTDYSSWQWSSRLRFPEIANKEFDISADYNSSFTSSNSTPKPDPQPDRNAPVSYSSHVKDKGWLNFVSNDNISGTVGEARRIEALKMTISNKFSGNIEYQSHIQNIGWESGWKTNGQVSGTTGQGKQIEALKIRLTGEVSKQYDIYYRVHSQAFGWLNWVKNGESAGTEGFTYRLEAYQVKLVPKGQAAPSGQGKGFYKYQDANVSYQSHVQYKGWMPSVQGGQISGTVGNSLRLEAVKLKITNNPLAFSGNIEYQTHSQNIGWQNWKNNFNVAGTEGKGLRAEALKIRLTGNLALHYNVYYRAHSQDIGWQNWVKNGEVAGTTGKKKQMEAIQVKIVRKNGVAPK